MEKSTSQDIYIIPINFYDNADENKLILGLASAPIPDGETASTQIKSACFSKNMHAIPKKDGDIVFVNSIGKKSASQDINIIPNNFADTDENKYSLQSSLSTPMQVVKLANNPLYVREAMTNNFTDKADENKLPLGLASVPLQ